LARELEACSPDSAKKGQILFVSLMLSNTALVLVSYWPSMTLNLDKASLKLALFDPSLASQLVLTHMADEFANGILEPL
jgi:hypothetical protein